MSGRSPGRNDPCPCGSGRKYKRCCLPGEEARQIAEATTGRIRMGSPDEPDGKLRRRIIRFLEEEIPEGDDYRREAVRAWLGRPRGHPESLDQEWEESEFIAFMDYAVHDFIATGYDAPTLEIFYRKKAAELPRRELSLLECWRENSVGFYEVQEVRQGTGVVVKDLFWGEDVFVRDVSASRQLKRWDIFAGRVLKEPQQHTLSGVIMRIPRFHRTAVLEEVRKKWQGSSHPQTRAGFRAFLKTRWPELRRFISEEGARLPEFRTGTGEPVLFCRTWCEVLDHPAVQRHLEAMPELEYMGSHEEPHLKGERYDWVDRDPAPLEPREEGATFQTTWYTPEGKEGGVILGNITLFQTEMEVGCLSKERLDRLTAMLEERMGPAIRRKSTLVQEPEEALEQFRRSGKDKEKIEKIPPEVERKLLRKYFTDYYTRWVDMPIPALDGLTPRQAAKDPACLPKLQELLKDFEHSERNPEGPRVPGFSQLRLIRRLLGLKETAASSAAVPRHASRLQG